MNAKQPVSPERVGQIAARIRAMSLRDKERLADELFGVQPTVLTSALVVARRTDLPGEVRDMAIELALVLFECLREELCGGDAISEARIERCVERNATMWRFLDRERDEDFTRSVEQTVADYPEPSLLAYTVGRITELKLEDPEAIMALKSMLEACVDAKWGAGGALISDDQRTQAIRDQLRVLGDPRDPWRDRPEARDYVGELELTEADIPHLIAVLERRAVPDDQVDEAEREEPGTYAPIHAWRALGQLRAVEAVEPMLAMLDELDERMDDWSLEEFPVVWSLIGEPAIEPLEQYLADRARREYSHICVVSGLRRLVERHPDMRQRVVGVLTRRVDDLTAHSPAVTGFVISGLLDLHATEAAEAIERAYAADAVDLTICGNWASVRAELGVQGTGVIPEEQAHAALRHPVPPLHDPGPSVTSEGPAPAQDGPGDRAEKAIA